MQIECALCDCVLCVLFIEVRDLHTSGPVLNNLATLLPHQWLQKLLHFDPAGRSVDGQIIFRLI